MKQLIKKIKIKKYKTLSDELIQTEISDFLKLKPKAKEKDIIKHVKTRLHKTYGTFQTKKKKTRNIKNAKLILETTLSTKERINIYQELYKKIFQITKTPKTILDIGSGMNPVSYEYLKIKPKYIAIEIDQEDVNFLNKFFKTNKIEGKAILLPINESNLKKLPKADIAFLFKTVDTLEKKKGHKSTEQLIKALKTKHIVISFPTKTISQKQMKRPYRGWLEQLLKRLKYKFKRIIYPNEIFYIISKPI